VVLEQVSGQPLHVTTPGGQEELGRMDPGKAYGTMAQLDGHSLTGLDNLNARKANVNILLLREMILCNNMNRLRFYEIPCALEMYDPARDWMSRYIVPLGLLEVSIVRSIG
jgi:hypothetical protein